MDSRVRGLGSGEHLMNQAHAKRKCVAAALAVSMTIFASKNLHAEEALLRCDFEHVEIQEAPFPNLRSSIFIGFEEKTTKVQVTDEILNIIFPFSSRTQTGSIVTTDRIAASYRGPALYLNNEHRDHYFNLFKIEINRLDGTFHADAAPWYSVFEQNQEYFAAAGNISDPMPDAPLFLLYQSVGWGKCRRYLALF
jgi:hypothetical protein